MKKHIYRISMMDTDTNELVQIIASEQLSDLLPQIRRVAKVRHGNWIRTQLLEQGEYKFQSVSRQQEKSFNKGYTSTPPKTYEYVISVRRWEADCLEDKCDGCSCYKCEFNGGCTRCFHCKNHNAYMEGCPPIIYSGSLVSKRRKDS